MVENQGKKVKNEGIKKYEKFILGICNAEYWSVLTDEEKNGYYAVAMLLAYQDGVSPNLKDFAYKLRVSPLLLEEPFNNLRANGVFNPIYKKKEATRDGININSNHLPSFMMDSEKRSVVDYCWVAGIGSGHCGLK